jgi:hypothetical protein
MKRTWRVIPMVLLILTGLLAHRVSSDFALGVRLQLLARGHPHATLIPAKSGSVFLPNMTIASLVNENSTNIGCVDTIGGVYLAGDKGHTKFDAMEIMFIADIVELCCIMLTLVAVGFVAQSFSRRKNQTGKNQTGTVPG